MYIEIDMLHRMYTKSGSQIPRYLHVNEMIDRKERRKTSPAGETQEQKMPRSGKSYTPGIAARQPS